MQRGVPPEVVDQSAQHVQTTNERECVRQAGDTLREVCQQTQGMQKEEVIPILVNTRAICRTKLNSVRPDISVMPLTV